MPILGLPLGFFPTILPSNTSFNKLFPRTTCPIQFFFRFTIAVQSTSLHLPRPVLLHLSSYLANSSSPFFSTHTSRKRSTYPLPPFSLSTFHNHTTPPAIPMS